MTHFGSARRPTAPLDTFDPVIGTADLPGLGIHYNLNHLRRMWRAGKFPKPFKISANRLGWRRSVIVAWIDERTRPGADATTDKELPVASSLPQARS